MISCDLFSSVEQLAASESKKMNFLRFDYIETEGTYFVIAIHKDQVPVRIGKTQLLFQANTTVHELNKKYNGKARTTFEFPVPKRIGDKPKEHFGRWHIKTATKLEDQEKILAEGYEPFSVVGRDGGDDIVYFRVFLGASTKR